MREWIRDEPKPKVSKVAKKRTVRDPDAPLPDHCCANCRHWSKPAKPDDDPFGQCRAVGVVAKRVPGGPEAGTAIPVDILNRMDSYPAWDYMRTREWFASCSRYAAGLASEAATEPGNREQFVKGALFQAIAERREDR